MAKNKITQKKQDMDRIVGLKTEMSQVFNDHAKVLPFTSIKLVNTEDMDKVKGLEVNSVVRVTGVSKGKGYTGTMKKWNFSGGPATHGSQSHRRPGSIGAQGYGRVLKGRKMPGRHGHKKVTFDTLFLGIDEKTTGLRLKGPVPGARNSLIYIYIPKSDNS